MTAHDQQDVPIERYIELASELESLVEALGIAIDEDTVLERGEQRHREIMKEAEVSEDMVDEVQVTAVDALASVRTLVDLVGNSQKLETSERMCYRDNPASPMRYYDEGPQVHYWLCEHETPHYRFAG